MLTQSTQRQRRRTFCQHSVLLVFLLILGACDFTVSEAPGDGGRDAPSHDGPRSDALGQDALGSDGPRGEGLDPQVPTEFCASMATCWENPLPQGNNLYGLWGTSPTSIYAVGDASTVLHFDGTTWRFEENPSMSSLMDVWGSGPQDIYALNVRHGLLHYDGTAWKAQEQKVFGDTFFRGIWGSGPKDIFAVGGGKTIAHYDGTGWKMTPVKMTTTSPSPFNNVWGSSSSDVWTASYFGIAHFDGTTWREVNPTLTKNGVGPLGVWGKGPGDVFFNGDEVHRFHGGSWTHTKLGDSQSETAICGNGPHEIYALRNELNPPKDRRHRVWKYDGSKWAPLAFPPTTKRISRLWAAGPGRFFAVGEGGTILGYDAAKGWTSYATGQGATITSLWGASATDVFAGQRGGGMLHRDAKGWTPMTFSPTEDVQALWGTGPSSVYASAGGAMWHYDGATWTQMAAPKFTFTTGLWGRSDHEVYATANSHENSRSTHVIVRYDGTTWKVIKETDSTMHALWGAKKDILFAVGEAARILRYDGHVWHAEQGPVSPIVTLRAIWGSGPYNVYAIGSSMVPGGKAVVLQYDGTWVQQEIPMSKGLTAIWGRNDHEIYAVGSGPDGGTILVSDGKTWKRMHIRLGQSLMAIWGDSVSSIFVGGLHGTILHRP